jgi:menaquinol-cytochrome c reductase iron-sulfur subunit
MNADPEEKPCAAAPSPEELTRRKFFERISIVLFGFGSLLLLVPMVGFVVAPLFKRSPEVWRKVGAKDDFKIGATTEVVFEDAAALPWAGVASKTAAWLRRVDEETFIAFSVNCTHLGCPVRWLEQAELFMCPCHGGVYYKDGTVAAGPPPLPLPRYQVRIRNGKVEIRTTPTPITRA